MEGGDGMLKRLIVSVLLIVSLMPSLASAATYYIDYENGLDSSTGLSPAAAWKHCPGDAGATGMPASKVLQAGDVIRFRGGVHYPGEISATADGAEGNPIIYDGNSDGSWGTGMAILDGSEVLSGWTRCESQAACGGNPNWNSIYYSFVPGSVTAFTANLHENEQMLTISQEPDQPDTFYQDETDNFYAVPEGNMTTTSIKDPSVFSQPDENYWNGSYINLWVLPNVVERREIISYRPSENMITYAETNDPSGYSKYSIYNSIHAIDQPGEFFVNNLMESGGTHKVYLWSLNADIGSQEITVSVRKYGFNIAGHDYIEVRGFRIQKFSGDQLREGVGIGTVTGTVTIYGITVKNNLITRNRYGSRGGYGGVYIAYCRNCLVENNVVKENALHMGIFSQGGTTRFASNVTVRNNTIIKNGGTGIDFYYTSEGKITGNTILDNRGTHANGLTVYLFSSNILVENNTIINSNIGLTIQESVNITVRGNLIDGNDSTIINAAVWSGPYYNGEMYGLSFIGNTFVRGDNGLSISSAFDTSPLVVRDNIIQGHSKLSNTTYSNNLYVGTESSEVSLEESEVYHEQLNEIFNDPENGGFLLLRGVTAGTLPNTGDPCFMSSTGSHVGARPCMGCTDSGPVAVFTADRTSGYEPLAVNFDASYSISCSAPVVSYEWDFGDRQGGSGERVSHAFSSGTYDTVLTVTDQNSNTDSASRMVHVLPSATPNLNVYLPLDNNVLDSSGKNNHGSWYAGSSPSGSSSFSSGRSGQAVSLDGTAGGLYVLIDDNNDVPAGMLDGMDNLTLSVWVKKKTASEYREILLKHISYKIQLTSTGVSAYVYNDTDQRHDISVNTGTADTEWHHIALTYNGSAINLYLDGSMVKSVSASGKVDRNPSRDIYIGKDPWGNSFNGYIDEVRIYDRALTEGEVHGLFAGQVHASDANQDGCIQLGEMIAFMNRWKMSNADVPMPELMESIGLWKIGTGC
jgi:parallel beta-helix repeat protein